MSILESNYRIITALGNSDAADRFLALHSKWIFILSFLQIRNKLDVR